MAELTDGTALHQGDSYLAVEVGVGEVAGKVFTRIIPLSYGVSEEWAAGLARDLGGKLTRRRSFLTGWEPVGSGG